MSSSLFDQITRPVPSEKISVQIVNHWTLLDSNTVYVPPGAKATYQDKPITEVFDFWSHTFEIINSSLTKLIKYIIKLKLYHLVMVLFYH